MHTLFVLIPLLSVLILNLTFKAMRKAAFGLLTLVCVFQACIAACRLLGFSGMDMFVVPGFTSEIDRLGAVALASAALVAFCALSAGYATIQDSRRRFDFVNLLLLALAGMNGVAIGRDVFSLYVFIEITAIASYILISLFKEKPALEAAFKYIILSAVASALMLAAISLLMLVTGSTGFSAIRQALSSQPRGGLVTCALALFACGLFIKGGQMPFHGWLPDVYSQSPAPVSVFLAGVVTKLLGAFVLLRLSLSVVDFGAPLRGVILVVGTLSIVAGALAALGQKDLKRMFAYSSISQIGYILIGIGAGSPLGIAGAALHLFNHSVFKTTLFLNAAAVESRGGTREISRLGGLAPRMPVTAATSIIASLSAAGIPPLAGFWSKLLIVMALWMAGFKVYAAIAVIASVITLAYLLLVQRDVFGGPAREEFANVKETGAGILFPVCVLTAITVGLGLAFPFLLKLLGL